MISNLFLLNIIILINSWKIRTTSGEIISGCTVNNNNNYYHRRTNNDRTSVKLSCKSNGYILVQNVTFGVHKISSLTTTTTTPICSYQPGDCTTRTTSIGMECNGLNTCDLDLNPQYLHICSQYSDYMVLEYSCLYGSSLSVCDTRSISTSINKEHRLFLRSPSYPEEYENSLNCSCQIDTRKSSIKFLDFYLEERDEMNICSRDNLIIDKRSFCGSNVDDSNHNVSTITMNSSFKLTFKTNDVITRKGFWLMIDSNQPLQISCNNQIDSTTIRTTVTTTKVTTIPTFIPNQSATSESHLSQTESSRSNSNNAKRHHTLSYILILIITFVVTLLFLNLILIILCWRQRRPKEPTDSKASSSNRSFFRTIRSSTLSTSSITYGETPVLTLIDSQKQPTLSSRYIFPPNQQNLDTTPSTSTTTATGPYEDLNESMTSQRQYHKQQSSDNHSLYIQHQPTFSSPSLPYNRMIHFPPPPIHCHFSTPIQTFYPPQPVFDSQHIYETIQDKNCPYQRLAATLRRQYQPQCTCYCEHVEQNHQLRTQDNNNSNTEPNPETLV